jgi:hypothetical protein
MSCDFPLGAAANMLSSKAGTLGCLFTTLCFPWMEEFWARPGNGHHYELRPPCDLLLLLMLLQVPSPGACA